MTYNPETHLRHSILLKEYDYSQAGAYFVTICTWQRECLFGDVVDGVTVLNDIGRIVETVFSRLPEHFTTVQIDEYAIMPNHFHAIIFIHPNVGAKMPVSDQKRAKHDEAVLSPLHGTMSGSLCSIVQNFKSFSSRKISQSRANPGCPVWQRNYYERVIRNEYELSRAREYIVNNPQKWSLDRENPINSL
jgi:REP element-mobilizing transposase RayT